MGDLSRGYSFTDGLVNDCSSAHLHTLVESAAIQPTFHSDKASAGASPAAATHEIMLYRSSDTTFYKATLAAAIFDSDAFLSGRTAKTIPVAADLLLLADSAAANAYKKITLANALFNAAAFPVETLDGAADLFAVYNASDSTVRKLTLGRLVLAAPPAGTTLNGTTDIFLMANSGTGALRAQSLVGIITQAAALTTPDGSDMIALYDVSAAAYKRTTLVELISGLVGTLTTPVGGETIPVVDTGTLKKMTLTSMRSLMQASYALVSQVQNSGTNGGVTTANTWTARNFNTSEYDPNGIVAQVNGYLVLQAGTYRFRARAQGYQCGQFRLRLYNSTGAVVLAGPSAAVRCTTNVSVEAELVGRFTIAANQQITLDQYCTISNGGVLAYDFGLAMTTGEQEKYCGIEFWLEP